MLLAGGPDPMDDESEDLEGSSVGFEARTGLIGTGWTIYSVGRGWAERRPDALRLAVRDARAGELADAQLDDYHGRQRNHLRWRPPLVLRVRARWSAPFADLRGTTGFGFWNDPLDARGRFRASPGYLWFFHASPPSRVRGAGGQGHGFVAAALRGGALPPGALTAGNLALRLRGLRRLATRAGGRVVPAGEAALRDAPDPTDWHAYELTWTTTEARFAIDGREVAVLSRPGLPAGPLGFVAWIDNNWPALEDDGSYRGGRLEAPGEQWLELGSVTIDRLPR